MGGKAVYPIVEEYAKRRKAGTAHNKGAISRATGLTELQVYNSIENRIYNGHGDWARDERGRYVYMPGDPNNETAADNDYDNIYSNVAAPMSGGGGGGYSASANSDNTKVTSGEIDRIAGLERQVRLLTEQLRMSMPPAEPAEAGSVVVFDKAFGRQYGDKYHYAAIKAKGKWYLTGEKTYGYSWAQLLEFISSKERERPLMFRMNSMVELKGL